MTATRGRSIGWPPWSMPAIAMPSGNFDRSLPAWPTCGGSGQLFSPGWPRTETCWALKDAVASGWPGPTRSTRSATTRSPRSSCGLQIGVMLGPDAELADVASFLGEKPPEGMDQDEFDIRVTHMRDSLKPRKESFLELRGYVAEAIAELQAHELKIQEAAARRLEQEAGGAAVDSSPEGIRLMNYITNNEKGFDAALRRHRARAQTRSARPETGPEEVRGRPCGGGAEAGAGALARAGRCYRWRCGRCSRARRGRGAGRRCGNPDDDPGDGDEAG